MSENMDLTDEINDADFAELDALLEQWSHEDAEMPQELHARIMSSLDHAASPTPITSIAVKNPRQNLYRYFAAAALAAGVLLASVSINQNGLGGSGNYYQESPTDSAVITVTHTMDTQKEQAVVLMNEPPQGKAKSVTDDYFDAVNSAWLDDEFLASNSDSSDIEEIDWQKESLAKLALLKEEKTALFYAKDSAQKTQINARIAWLEEIRAAIAAQDKESYRTLESSSPYNE